MIRARGMIRERGKRKGLKKIHICSGGWMDKHIDQ